MDGHDVVYVSGEIVAAWGFAPGVASHDLFTEGAPLFVVVDAPALSGDGFVVGLGVGVAAFVEG